MPRRQRADVARWQFWESCHWDPACATLIFERMLRNILGQGDPIAAHVERGEADVRQLGAVLDGALAGRSHLCGKQLTVADFSVGAWLNYAERAGYPIDGLPGDPALVRRTDGAAGVAGVDRRAAVLSTVAAPSPTSSTSAPRSQFDIRPVFDS